MLKRTLALALTLMLLASPALAVFKGSMTFTHPEIGEPLSIYFINGMPLFKIYGFTYYQVVNPAQPYRGLTVNRIPELQEDLPTAPEALAAFFLDVTSETGQSAAFDYTEDFAEYADSLNALPLEDRVRALLLLNGFEGPTGYDRLAAVPGFEAKDLSAFKENYVEYTVNTAGRRYPFRVVQFRVDEGEVHEYYLERYSFVMLEGQWRLTRVTKEYADEYAQRVYIHGLTGYAEDMVYDAAYELLRQNEWGMAAQEVAKYEGAQPAGNTLDVQGIDIFRIPAQVRYTFDQDGLCAARYLFGNEQAYYSALISLYMRFGDPVEVKEDGSISWSTNDTLIRLLYDKTAPTLEVSKD